MEGEFTQVQERRIDTYFWWSVVIKGVISAAEIAAGIVVFFIPVTTLTAPLIQFAGSEVFEEPGNLIAQQLLHISQQLAVTSGTFIALYLLSRGAVKLALIIALLKHKLWAYPSSLVVIGLFVAYQLYEIVVSHSAAIVALTLFDFIVMYFIWREYQVLLVHHGGVHKEPPQGN